MTSYFSPTTLALLLGADYSASERRAIGKIAEQLREAYGFDRTNELALAVRRPAFYFDDFAPSWRLLDPPLSARIDARGAPARPPLPEVSMPRARWWSGEGSSYAGTVRDLDQLLRPHDWLYPERRRREGWALRGGRGAACRDRCVEPRARLPRPPPWQMGARRATRSHAGASPRGGAPWAKVKSW